MKEQKNPPTSQAHYSIAVSVFINFVVHAGDMTLAKIFEIIRSQKLQNKINLIRQLIAEGRDADAAALKKILPAFTVSCRIEGRRNFANIKGYSGIVVLDIDKLAPAVMERIIGILLMNEFVLGFFRSPSGHGIKFFVATDGLLQNHALTYDAVASYFEGILNVKIDRSGSEAIRLCYLSYDPNAVLKDSYAIFKAPKELPPQRVKRKRIFHPCYVRGMQFNMFSECVKTINLYAKFEEGNRNNYCYRLARRCKLRGISEAEALEKILKYFDYDQKEIVATVRSAFKR